MLAFHISQNMAISYFRRHSQSFMDDLHHLNAWQYAEAEDLRQFICFLKGRSYCLCDEGRPFEMEEVN